MQSVVKKTFDFLVSIQLLILFLPIILVISLFSAVFIGFPIFFTQERVGLNDKIFKIYKFRTMHVNENLNEFERISKWGNFLRKYSLDELPQLFNIIKGELSLVGPRPLLPEYLPLYSSEQKMRHSVLPGITGWAQINGRNSLMWKEKFDLDLWYVKNQSFWLDLKILLMTARKVLSSKDINSSSSMSMPKFNGKN